NSTYVFGCVRARASTSASSSRLACVQVHCGCATNTSVGVAVDAVSPLSDGQCPGAFALCPGRLSYAQRIHRPETTPHSQKQAKATTHSRRHGFGGWTDGECAS